MNAAGGGGGKAESYEIGPDGKKIKTSGAGGSKIPGGTGSGSEDEGNGNGHTTGKSKAGGKSHRNGGDGRGRKQQPHDRRRQGSPRQPNGCQEKEGSQPDWRHGRLVLRRR